MKPHVKTYLDYFEYGIDDWIPCENCLNRAVDIHHLTFRPQGGTNDINNLVAVCRECYNKAHNDAGFNEYLRIIHQKNL